VPTYTYRCEQGHIFEHYSPLSGFQARRLCACHQLASLQITPPLSITVVQDVCYDSPIDGRPITSHAQRQEDMKQSGCIPYDPEMKTDSLRRIREQDTALDRSIDLHVEQVVGKMPTKQRAKLYSEVVEQGMDCEVQRLTPGA